MGKRDKEKRDHKKIVSFFWGGHSRTVTRCMRDRDCFALATVCMCVCVHGVCVCVCVCVCVTGRERDGRRNGGKRHIVHFLFWGGGEGGALTHGHALHEQTEIV